MAKESTTRQRRKASGWLLWAGIGALGAAVVLIGYFAFAAPGDRASRADQTPVVTDEPEVRVAVVDNEYEPNHLTIKPGTEVTWEFSGDLPHNVVDEAGAFTSDIMRRGEYVRVFDEPAEYRYYCTLHHAMIGTLIVAP
jgi:plastocyanin